MSKYCPTCGSEEPDDQSVFCRQCGSRFPKDVPEIKSGMRQAAREDVRSEPGSAVAVPNGSAPKYTRRKQGKFTRYLSFDIFITKTAVSVIYAIGALALTIVSVLYLVLGMVKPSLLPVLPTQNPLMLTPLFWVLLLIFGNLFWRIFCELLVILFTVNQSLVSIYGALTTLEQPGLESEEDSGYTTCPICSDTVPVDELQKCDRCGVMGCKNCIRTAGFMHKVKTCKTCFEKR